MQEAGRVECRGPIRGMRCKREACGLQRRVGLPPAPVLLSAGHAYHTAADSVEALMAEPGSLQARTHAYPQA